jgi:hypothetical protein
MESGTHDTNSKLILINHTHRKSINAVQQESSGLWKDMSKGRGNRSWSAHPTCKSVPVDPSMAISKN